MSGNAPSGLPGSRAARSAKLAVLRRRRGHYVSRTALAGSILTALVLSVLGAIVVAHEPKGKPKVLVAGPSAAVKEKPLPAPVQDMLEGIRAAIHSGIIEELRTPLEWNELPPMVAPEKVDDAIAYWKKSSGDGEGRETLAVLAKLLDAGHTKLAIGRDTENMDVYVWPYLAEAPLDKLTPAQEVDLYRLVSPAEARRMREKKKWTWYRLAIGADGTWHSFMRHD